jgi:putative acetyltransferase
MSIRLEEEIDWFAVHTLNTAAFDTPAEALLVDALRQETTPTVSLVAEEDGIIVGHIFFSPVTLLSRPDLKLMGLAPMAVDKDYRRKGIGAALVRGGLEQCEAIGVAAVVVIGDPTYYVRFGFLPASKFGLRCEFEVPSDAFMALELERGAFDNASGIVRYHPSFSLL